MFKSCWIHGCPLTPDFPTAHLFQCSKPKAGLVPVYLVHRYRRTGIYRDARRRKLGKVCQNQWLEPPPWGWGVTKDDSHHPQLRLLWLAREGLGVVMSCGRVCRPLQKICFRMMPLLPGGFSFTSSGGRGSKPLELVPPAGLLLVENMASCCQNQRKPRKGCTFAQCHSIIPHLYDLNKKMEEGPMIARTSSFTTVNGTILSLMVNAMCLPPGNLPAWRCWGRQEQSNHHFQPFPSILSQSPPFFFFEHFRRPCIFL